jgi:hypothetical protein
MGENRPQSLTEIEVAELHAVNVVYGGRLHKHRRPWSEPPPPPGTTSVDKNRLTAPSPCRPPDTTFDKVASVYGSSSVAAGSHRGVSFSLASIVSLA